LFVHIALLVTATVQEGIKRRVTEAGLVAHEIDHGFCKSLYVQDPDGLLVEFTTEAPDAEEINLAQRKVAHETLRRWMEGDRTVNNDNRPQTLQRGMGGETP
jgi:catechol-2,3-dioxygenase